MVISSTEPPSSTTPCNQLVKTLKQEISRLKRLVTKDELTQIDNLRAFNEKLPQEIANTIRRHSQLVLVTFDIDYFKEINDLYGHPWGDIVLKELAQTVTAIKREGDHFARTGGEEFHLIFPEDVATNLDHFNLKRYHDTIAKINRSPKGNSTPVTISAGAIILDFRDTSTTPNITPNILKDLADQNLYRSKHAGRNRLTVTKVVNTNPPTLLGTVIGTTIKDSTQSLLQVSTGRIY